MQAQEELMLRFKQLIKAELEEEVNLSELPKEGGLYAEIGAGITKRKYLRQKELCKIPILLMSKDIREDISLDRISRICNHLKKLGRCPNGETYGARFLRVSQYPNKTGRTEDGQVVYSAIFEAEIYY